MRQFAQSLLELFLWNNDEIVTLDRVGGAYTNARHYQGCPIKRYSNEST